MALFYHFNSTRPSQSFAQCKCNVFFPFRLSFCGLRRFVDLEGMEVTNQVFFLEFHGALYVRTGLSYVHQMTYMGERVLKEMIKVQNLIN